MAWGTLVEQGRLFHHHGRVTVLGRAVRIESVRGVFSGPGRSVGHLFVYVDG